MRRRPACHKRRRPAVLKWHTTIEKEAGQPEVVSGEEEVCRLPEANPGKEKAGGLIWTGERVGWAAEEEVEIAAAAWRRRRIAMVLCLIAALGSLTFSKVAPSKLAVIII